jgi:hypothetical protein
MINVVSVRVATHPSWIGADCLSQVVALDRVCANKGFAVWRWKSKTGVFGVPWLSIRWGDGLSARLVFGPQAVETIRKAKEAGL